MTTTSRIEKFAAWWLKTRPMNPPADGVYMRVGANTGTILYRDGEFQVQMFICDPDSDITDHTHPNVDSVQVYVSGDMYFRRNGEQLITPEQAPLVPSGFSHRVPPGEIHGAKIGPRGGVFITIQEWLNGETPRSVHLDWSGRALSQEHAAEIPDRAHW